MLSTQVNQRTLEDYLLVWIDAFLIDRKAQNMSRGTLVFYRRKLKLFTDYCEGQQLKQVSEITPSLIREFLLRLEATGHNSGGVHAAYRSLRAFLRWWEKEAEPDDWKNPIAKVKPPKVSLEPVDIQDVYRIMETCPLATAAPLRQADIRRLGDRLSLHSR